MTDTKSVWMEGGHLSHAEGPVSFTNSTEAVMSSNQFARRWRHCNSGSPFPSETEEDTWRTNMVEQLSKAHTLGGITDLSFTVSESHYAVSGVNFNASVYIRPISILGSRI